MYPATSLGRDFAPRMMISLKTGLTADAIDLGYDEDDVFYQTTPAYGGSILAHIVILECRPQMVTVRPKIFTPLEPDESRTGEVITEHVTVSLPPPAPWSTTDFCRTMLRSASPAPPSSPT